MALSSAFFRLGSLWGNSPGIGIDIWFRRSFEFPFESAEVSVWRLFTNLMGFLAVGAIVLF